MEIFVPDNNEQTATGTAKLAALGLGQPITVTSTGQIVYPLRDFSTHLPRFEQAIKSTLLYANQTDKL